MYLENKIHTNLACRQYRYLQLKDNDKIYSYKDYSDINNVNNNNKNDNMLIMLILLIVILEERIIQMINLSFPKKQKHYKICQTVYILKIFVEKF